MILMLFILIAIVLVSLHQAYQLQPRLKVIESSGLFKKKSLGVWNPITRLLGTNQVPVFCVMPLI